MNTSRVLIFQVKLGAQAVRYMFSLTILKIGHFENKNITQLALCESEIKAAVQYIINGVAARTTFQDSLSFYLWNGIFSIISEDDFTINKVIMASFCLKARKKG